MTNSDTTRRIFGSLGSSFDGDRAVGRYAQYFGFRRRLRKAVPIGALLAADFTAALGAVYSGMLFVGLTGISVSPTRPTMALFFLLTSAAAGLYDRTAFGAYERFRQRTFSVTAFLLFVGLLDLPLRYPGYDLLLSGWEGFSLLVISHYMDAATRQALTRTGLWGAATVLVGHGKACRNLANLLSSRPGLGLTPIGMIASDSGMPRKRSTLPVVGTTRNFRAIDPRLDIEVAIFANPRDLASVPNECPAFAPSCRFLLAENVQNIQSLWLRTRMLGPMVGVEIRREFYRQRNHVLKRAFDLAIGVPLGILLLPAIALAGLLIKLADAGPAFYVQKRVGRDGNTIRMFKLRTMYSDAERRLEEYLRCDPEARAEWHRFCKLKNDPRVLPFVGNFIRRLSLDELPQVWNVVRGDMSLVGPRPLPSYHVDKFDLEFRELRLRVTPGITGLWQISARGEGDLQTWKEHDSFYIRNWSLLLDIYIILETLPAVLSARGAH